MPKPRSTGTRTSGGFRLCPICRSPEEWRHEEAAFPVAWRCRECGAIADFSDGVPITARGIAEAQPGFDPDDFAFLAGVEQTNFWFVARRELICQLARIYAPGARSYIEIGCGSGNVIAAIARQERLDRIVGTELHTIGLAQARAFMPAGVQLVQADARRIPFRSAFTLAGAFDVLEHIEEDEAVLREVHNALQPGGVFIATVPQHPFLWSAPDVAAYHVRRYGRNELQDKLIRAGFRIIFATSYTVSLFPLMLLSRTLARRREEDVERARQTARREFNVSPILNRFLTCTLRLENALSARGVRWPFGGSRVVVARKD